MFRGLPRGFLCGVKGFAEKNIGWMVSLSIPGLRNSDFDEAVVVHGLGVCEHNFGPDFRGSPRQ